MAEKYLTKSDLLKSNHNEKHNYKKYTFQDRHMFSEKILHTCFPLTKRVKAKN